MKNILLRIKTGKQIRGSNREANISIVFFAGFIVTAIALSLQSQPTGSITLLSDSTAKILALTLFTLSLIVSASSLLGLKESWRVGVIENQTTELISVGIYRFSRNPYFLSYLLMFAACSILLQNLILVALSLVGFFLIDKMVRKEESYLQTVHGQAYSDYKRSVPRYLLR